MIPTIYTTPLIPMSAIRMTTVVRVIAVTPTFFLQSACCTNLALPATVNQHQYIGARVPALRLDSLAFSSNVDDVVLHWFQALAPTAQYCIILRLDSSSKAQRDRYLSQNKLRLENIVQYSLLADCCPGWHANPWIILKTSCRRRDRFLLVHARSRPAMP